MEIKALNDKLELLKSYSQGKKLAVLTNNIRNLNFSEEYISKLSSNEIMYVHVKLHNALSYKKPFAPLKSIKIVHDKIATMMKNHIDHDDLDTEKFK